MVRSVFAASVMFSLSSWAQPKLNLLKDREWKGTCRKVVNEGNQELKNQPYLRLQSSYSFQGGELIWWVKSFSDLKCTKVQGGNKLTFSCDQKDKEPYAKCKQTKREESKDGITWEPKHMVDHAGYANTLELWVKIQSLEKNKMKITTIGESEEESEILSQ